MDPIDPENFRQAITPKTKAVFTESLANPGGVVCDIEAIASIAHTAGIPCIVDNTLPSPALCRPFDYGVDIIVHSTTKFISGHGNAMGGVPSWIAGILIGRKTINFRTWCKVVTHIMG